MNIGKAIKQVRTIKHPNLKQKDFSNCVGITQAYLSQIESNKKNASTEVLQKIADFCEIPLSILFWFSLEESEIPKRKKEAYKILKPCIDEMISQIITS